MFLLNLMACLFVCGWYTVVVKCLTPGKAHIDEVLFDKLSSVVRKDVRRDAVRGNERGCCLGR